jgi:serine/threonine-protein kinase
MSPEQWMGEPATPESDVFAFGLIFFELMTSRRALPEGSLNELLESLRDPQLPVRLAGELPERFRETTIAMLAMDPRSRPTAENLQVRFRE